MARQRASRDVARIAFPVGGAAACSVVAYAVVVARLGAGTQVTGLADPAVDAIARVIVSDVAYAMVGPIAVVVASSISAVRPAPQGLTLAFLAAFAFPALVALASEIAVAVQVEGVIRKAATVA